MMQSMFLSSSSSLYLRVVLIFGPAISLARACLPSQRSQAATHSTPGKVTEVARSPEPCMPTPMMAKRILSLGAEYSHGAGMRAGSRKMVFAAIMAPVVPALFCKNVRLLISFFVIKPPNRF